VLDHANTEGTIYNNQSRRVSAMDSYETAIEGLFCILAARHPLKEVVLTTLQIEQLEKNASRSRK